MLYIEFHYESFENVDFNNHNFTWYPTGRQNQCLKNRSSYENYSEEIAWFLDAIRVPWRNQRWAIIPPQIPTRLSNIIIIRARRIRNILPLRIRKHRIDTNRLSRNLSETKITLITPLSQTKIDIRTNKRTKTRRDTLTKNKEILRKTI